MTIQPKRPDTEGSEEIGFGKKLLLLTLVCVAAYLGYKAFWSDSTESSIPRAMQVTYAPADFKMNLDDAQTLEILSNPQRYRKEFDALILNFNTNLVAHVANRMGINAQLRTACVNEYRKMHPYIQQMYFNDIVGLRDSTSQLYQTWYENQSASAVDILNEVASKYTCFFITNIIATVLKTQDGKLAVQGNKVETPCGIALTEGLRPMIKRLQDAAAIRDFSQAKGLMRERVEKAISELAVMELRDKKGIRLDNATKVWGYDVSTTNIEITAISIIKVGFNLNNYFNLTVNDKTKTVEVTLPQPQILSHEVFPKVENLDVGWLRELSSQDFNDNINKLRQAFRDDAYNSNIFDRSRQRAQEIMQFILSPMVKNVNRGYKINVRFQQANEAADYSPPPPNTPANTGQSNNPKPSNAPQYYQPNTKQ